MLNSCGHASTLRTRRGCGEGTVRTRLRRRQRGPRCGPGEEEERRWCGGAPERVELYVPHCSRKQVGALLQEVVGHARVVRLRPVLERTDAAPVTEVVSVVEERHCVACGPHHREDGDQTAPEEGEKEQAESVRAPTVAETFWARPLVLGAAAAHHLQPPARSGAVSVPKPNSRNCPALDRFPWVTVDRSRTTCLMMNGQGASLKSASGAVELLGSGKLCRETVDGPRIFCPNKQTEFLARCVYIHAKEKTTTSRVPWPSIARSQRDCAEDRLP